VGFGRLCGWLRDARCWRVGYTRKLFHFAIFTLAAVVGLAGGFGAVQAFGGAVAVVVLHAVGRAERSPLFRALARPEDAPHQRFYVLVPLFMTAAGGLSSNVLFGGCALVGYAVTGWGDAVGEPVGTRWGRHRYRVPTLTRVTCTRSLEGSAAVFLASSLAAAAALWVGDFELGGAALLTCALLVAVLCTLVEAVTFHSLDNLTIQLAASGSTWLLLAQLGS
jgi:phytol kinase